MRIALVYDAVYPFVKGGAERRYYEIAQQLSKNHEVCLIGYGWWGSQPPDSDNSSVRYISTGPPKNLYKTDGSRSPSEALSFGLSIIPTLFNGDFDIIDCCSFPYFSVLSSRAVTGVRRIPLVVTWLEYWGSYWHQYWGTKGIAGRLVEQLAVSASPNSVAISEFTRQRLLKGPFRRNPNTVETVPSGVSFQKIRSVKSEFPPSEIIYAGRLMPHKRVDLLIRALAELNSRGEKYTCRIIGDGPELLRLTKLTETLKLAESVDFLGFVPEEDMYAMMKSAKVMCLPSEREGFGNIVLEANCCGIPAIVTHSPQNASSELVKDGVTGIVCDPSCSSLADAIQTVIDSPTQYREEVCISYASQFDWREISNRMLDVYESVLSND
tara:strand:+ start:4021 stop:5166 length:1146 start_codon:yes stop_codon:yes gene_type:complete